MAKNSGIEWTDHTWNPWQGCRKVSEGCRYCYMYREKLRFGQNPAWVIRSSPSTFNAPLKWKDPARVFVCSWSDFFIEDADAWRPEAWDIMRQTPHLTYQILTKRPERIRACLPDDWAHGWDNVWLGVTGENQRAYDDRIFYLLDTPAPLHFLSAEPLLGPIDLGLELCNNTFFEGLRWVIAGGESGPGARPMEAGWARCIRDQCVAAGVPFFFKQWSGVRPKSLGRTLDGQEWTQVPGCHRD